MAFIVYFVVYNRKSPKALDISLLISVLKALMFVDC